jgi:hypothetical protein
MVIIIFLVFFAFNVKAWTNAFVIVGFVRASSGDRCFLSLLLGLFDVVILNAKLD